MPLSVVDVELYQDSALHWSWFYAETIDAMLVAYSLGRTLLHYPIFAGRVVSLLSSAGGSARRPALAVECNNAGAGFTVLRLEGVLLPRDRACGVATTTALAAWPRDLFQGRPLRELVDTAHPVLEVVVAHFSSASEGGSMLSVKLPHALVDGYSFTAFLAHVRQHPFLSCLFRSPLTSCTVRSGPPCASK